MSAVLVARREARQRAEAKQAQSPTPDGPALRGICLDCDGPAEALICRDCLIGRGA